MLRKQEPLTFEERLEKAFPGSEWVKETGTGSGPAEQDAALAGDHKVIHSVAVIGGAKFDEASLVTWLRTLPRDVILVSLAPRFTKDGEPFKGEFGTELLRLASEIGIRVDFVQKGEKSEGIYRDGAALSRVFRATSGDVILVGTGGMIQKTQAFEKDWAIRTATLGDRQLITIA